MISFFLRRSEAHTSAFYDGANVIALDARQKNGHAMNGREFFKDMRERGERDVLFSSRAFLFLGEGQTYDPQRRNCVAKGS